MPTNHSRSPLGLNTSHFACVSSDHSPPFHSGRVRCGIGSAASRIALTMFRFPIRHDENVTVRNVSTTPSEYDTTRLRGVT